MKVFWYSNAPFCATGYGQQTALMLPRLRAAGHEVAVLANYGVNGAVLDWQGFKVYPSGQEAFSNDVVGGFARDWFDGEPGLVITLYDTWPLDPKAFAGLNVASWTPIDHVPVPPKVISWFTESGAWPIAYSKFGKLSLEANGLNPVLYAPHGIDTSVFKPVPNLEAKRALGFDEDRFVVGMVAANNGNNPPRKAFDATFRAFASLRADCSDALLYLHTEPHGRYNKGVNIPAMLSQYEIKPDDVVWTDEVRYMLGGFPPHVMSVLYSAFDVLAAASLGEGFGLPTLEAQACGCPVIVNNFSAQPELCGSGWKTNGQLYHDTFQLADYSIPSDRDLAVKLKMAHHNKGNQQIRGLAREFAVGYDADKVFAEHWVPILEMLEATVLV